ncbi:unnamed protein product, partial [Prorocentrum cordatum]
QFLPKPGPPQRRSERTPKPFLGEEEQEEERKTPHRFRSTARPAMPMRLALAAAPASGGASSAAAPLELEVEAADTVAILKGRVRDREGIMEADQRLFYGGKQLEDARQLSDYNLVDGAQVVLVRRLPAAPAAGLEALCAQRRPGVHQCPAAGRVHQGAPRGAAVEGWRPATGA